MVNKASPNLYNALICGQNELVRASHALAGGKNGLPELLRDTYALGGRQHCYPKPL